MDRNLCYTGGDYMFAPMDRVHISLMDEEEVAALGEIAQDILAGERPGSVEYPRRLDETRVWWCSGSEAGRWCVDFSAGNISVLVDASADDLRWLVEQCSEAGIEQMHADTAKAVEAFEKEMEADSEQ